MESAYIRQKFIIESSTLSGSDVVADVPHQGQELATSEGGQAATEPGESALLARKGKGSKDEGAKSEAKDGVKKEEQKIAVPPAAAMEVTATPEKSDEDQGKKNPKSSMASIPLRNINNQQYIGEVYFGSPP